MKETIRKNLQYLNFQISNKNYKMHDSIGFYYFNLINNEKYLQLHTNLELVLIIL
jgi:hypothetical protein